MSKKISNSVFVALFAALICVSSFFTIPLVPGIPIVLKNMMIVLSGTLLGSFLGAAAAIVFLIAGILGLPVFANAGGIAAFLSPAGGYMIGYVVGALAAGLIAGTPQPEDKIRSGEGNKKILYIIRIVLSLLAGFIIIDLLGALNLLRLKYTDDAPANVAVFFSGIIPFIPADAIKFALSIPVSLALRPVAAQYLNRK
jgi:biotin transport system substrate-specific component